MARLTSTAVSFRPSDLVPRRIGWGLRAAVVAQHWTSSSVAALILLLMAAGAVGPCATNGRGMEKVTGTVVSVPGEDPMERQLAMLKVFATARELTPEEAAEAARQPPGPPLEKLMEQLNAPGPAPTTAKAGDLVGVQFVVDGQPQSITREATRPLAMNEQLTVRVDNHNVNLSRVEGLKDHPSTRAPSTLLYLLANALGLLLVLLVPVVFRGTFKDARRVLRHLRDGKAVTARRVSREEVVVSRGKNGETRRWKSTFQVELPVAGEGRPRTVTVARMETGVLGDSDEEPALYLAGEPVLMDELGFEPRVQPDGSVRARSASRQALMLVVAPVLSAVNAALLAWVVARAVGAFTG